MSYQQATTNGFPYGQCTWWADNRFHEVTGVYVPWPGNANSWSSFAPGYGWQVTSQPVQGPQIICLQAFVQGAGFLGHVAYVESVQNGNTVVSSNMNWGDTAAQRLSVQSVTFHTGPGVSFISLPGAKVVSGTQTLGFSTVASTSSTGIDLLKQFPAFEAWIGNPVRMVKLLTGIGCIFVALLILVAPDVIDGVKKAVNTAEIIAI